MKYSYSRVDCFKQCPFKYKCRYIDRIKTLPNYDANNPLVLGTALHRGIETDVDTAIKEYYAHFPVITDDQINEAIKLEILIPKVKSVLPKGEHEVKVECENFVGYIDLLCEGNNTPLQDIYDFKYTSNTNRYSDSQQLHIYKYYKGNIGKLYYVFVPKVNIRQKKTETLFEFRQRLREKCEQTEITIKEVPYDYSKVQEFLDGIKNIETATEYPRKESGLCERFCEYYGICKLGVDYEIVE